MKKINTTGSLFTTLECANCGKIYDPNFLQTFATCCNQPLIAKYDLERAPSKTILKDRPLNMWRYKELLPVFQDDNIVSLNEGFTPIIKVERAGASYGFTEVFIKDEAMNPTGSFKARGQSAAISKAIELGVTNCIIPTAGNAGGAMSTYCAKAGIKATVVMPSITPKLFRTECILFGAEVISIDGLINDCGAKVREMKMISDAFDVSTLKEPYRLEGKKTMGYEIAEQFNWNLPDVILYPTGGGTGLIGIWKAFEEMESMGWIGSKRPRMVAVQSNSCDGITNAFLTDQVDSEATDNGFTIANGLRVPKPYASKIILDVIRSTSGTAISVNDLQIEIALKEIAKKEGMLIAPEGAALWVAYQQLIDTNWILANEKVLMLNTGTGYKYLENLQIP